MRNLSVYLLLIFLGFPLLNFAQHDHHYADSLQNEHLPHWRIALFIGHTLIPDENAGENYFIPSWGLDIEYWINKEWGLGLHSDLELETFVILDNTGDEEGLERVSPLVVTLDALFKPWKGLVLQLGPGIEFERQENFTLMRMGVEYEIEFGHHWDISPTVFYDIRFNQYHTWSVALGVGKRF